MAIEIQKLALSTNSSQMPLLPQNTPLGTLISPAYQLHLTNCEEYPKQGLYARCKESTSISLLLPFIPPEMTPSSGIRRQDLTFLTSSFLAPEFGLYDGRLSPPNF